MAKEEGQVRQVLRKLALSVPIPNHLILSLCSLTLHDALRIVAKESRERRDKRGEGAKK